MTKVKELRRWPFDKLRAGSEGQLYPITAFFRSLSSRDLTRMRSGLKALWIVRNQQGPAALTAVEHLLASRNVIQCSFCQISDLRMQGMYRRALCVVTLLMALNAAAQSRPETPAPYDVRAHYTKYEYSIPMRDGVKLFTSIYVPKDTSKAYPFLMDRTPYSVSPYGVDNYRTSIGPSESFEKSGYIFVYQDVRGRWMSEGKFEEMRPHVANKTSKNDVDDSTDTYDTIEWLLKNVPNNNGRVGIWGISYPGFFTSASIIDSHPALKAASPQAPMTDLFMGDDAYHGGAFMLAANFSF